MADKITEREKNIAFACVHREGKSFAEVAAGLDLSVRQLYRIRQRPRVKAELRKLAFEYADDSLPEILVRMTDRANKGDTEAALAIVQIIKEWRNEKEGTI